MTGVVRVVISLTLLVACFSHADVPKMINYQGKITDSGGTPVPDGTYSMEFGLYDAASGGVPEWQSGTVSVNVSDGYFSILLGESPQDSIILTFDKNYWLGVTVESDVQTPRQRLGSVVYSYMSKGLVPGAVVSGEPSGASMAVFTATNTASTGMGYGLYGEAMSTGGIAVRGRSWSMTGQTYGGYFEIDSPSGAGVAAIANANTGNASGVFGATASTEGSAIYGFASATTGTARAIYGQASCATAYAGYFDGNTNIQGDLTVSGAINASGMGDITAVYAGTGLGGGGTTGDVTLNVEAPLSLTSSGTDPTIKGEHTATAGTTYGLQGVVYSSDGRAVHGYAYATSGTTYGVWGTSLSPDGRGIYGKASATSGNNYGVYGVSESTTGKGVYGYASSSSGQNYGVYGSTPSTSGTGVHGDASATTGTTYGVWGTTISPAGRGVYGTASHTTGTNSGVYGVSESTSGRGVYGIASSSSGQNCGVYGATPSPSGTGVYGYASAPTGYDRGVWGESASESGYGVYGYTSATEGPCYGVRGVTDSSEGYGTAGIASSTEGSNSIGVLGMCSSSGYGIWCSGDFAASGSKSCVVKTSQGPTLMYCQESPENWFEDFGEGQVVNGRCHIELDPLFLETVTIDDANPMKVFLQACDESCLDLVLKRGETGFDVVSAAAPGANGSFIYRVVAKRKGFEDRRLDYCEAAERDPYIYPELREKMLHE